MINKVKVLLYNLGFFFFAAAYSPVFLSKIRQAPDPFRLLRERLGLLPAEWAEKFRGQTVVWLHAVSVGEVMAVRKFLAGLVERLPEVRVVLTTVTPAGQKIARGMEGDRVTVAYFPFDVTPAVRNFFSVLKPCCLLLVETELWPNLLTEARRAGVPVGIVNARLSARSVARYRAFGFFSRPLFETLDFVLAQDTEDADRFAGLGVSRGRIRVFGNMKFDNAALETAETVSAVSLKREWHFNEKDPVWVAGSTHPGEEKILLAVFRQVRGKFPSLRMVIAPRHVERSEKLSGQIRQAGLRVERASARSGREIDVLVLDRMGILKDLYAMADAVFVGGSLVPHGGQNPVEPAAFGRAVLHGPHVFNFAKIYQRMDEAGGARQVAGEEELASALTHFLEDGAQSRTCGERALKTVHELRGATERTLQRVADFLNLRISNAELCEKLFPPAGGRP